MNAFLQAADPVGIGMGGILLLLVLLIVGFLIVRVIVEGSRRKKLKDDLHKNAAPHGQTPPSPQPSNRNAAANDTRSDPPRGQRRPTIFISYRRDDSSDITGRIYDRLAHHFGAEQVFKDVDSIPLGVDFRQHLDKAVARCDVFLTIIGSGWVFGSRGSTQSLLHSTSDFVRIEVESALQRDIPVIPLLVQSAEMPPADALPESLASLLYRNGIAIRPDPDFHNDMNRLIRAIETQTGA